MNYLKPVITAFLLHFIQGSELQNVPLRTCIIGAGYSGLATARYLKEYNMDFTVFEASEYLGGVWHFDPRVGVDEDGIPIFSKMYKNLRVNSPYLSTEFTDFPFPAGTSSYPTSECIFKYLSSFATKFHLFQHIQFRRLVTSVKRWKDQWQLTHWSGGPKENVSETCDYVVIATGLYNDPVWPKIQDADMFQGTLSHSHTYRDSEVYRNRRVLIVGAGRSGVDLAAQISKVASKLIHSHHRTINLPVHSENYMKKPDVKTFTCNGVIFSDGSYEKVDDVIFCTGYYNWHPFLDDSCGLIRTKKFILPLYRKIVNIKHPSMLFVGSVKDIFQKILNSQGHYAAALIAGRFQLPSEDEMMRSWTHEVNHNKRNIEHINGLHGNWTYYCDDLSQEARIPTIPPVFNSLIAFHDIIEAQDFIHLRDFDWRIIDDHNFDHVYSGHKELSCPIQ